MTPWYWRANGKPETDEIIKAVEGLSSAIDRLNRRLQVLEERVWSQALKESGL